MGFWADLFRNNGDREQLEQTIEQLKEENEKVREKERQTACELEKKEALVQEEKAYFQKELRTLQDEKEEMKKQLEDMEIRLKEYKDSYDAISKVLVRAQRDADCKVMEAERKAERITNQAKMETFLFQKKAEGEIQKKYEMNQERYTYAKNLLLGNMNIINETRENLVKTYEELRKLIEKMPLQMELLFPGEISEISVEEDKRKEIENIEGTKQEIEESSEKSEAVNG